MADVVIMAQNNPGWEGNDFTYRLGQVVDIFEDGRLGPQTHPRFYTIRLPNCTVEELQFLLEAPLGPAEFDPATGGDIRRPKGRRRDWFDWTNKIPQQVKDALQTNREVTLQYTATQIQNFITRFMPDDA